MPKANDFSQVTRLELINNIPCSDCVGIGYTPTGECTTCHGLGRQGREVIFHNPNKKIEISLQDDGRTLKIFIDWRDDNGLGMTLNSPPSGGREMAISKS